jgi:uncharacterized Tic20 family protein
MDNAQPSPNQPDPAQQGYPVNERGRTYQPGLADDDKTWAMFAHLGLLGHIVLPVLSIAIPLVIWLTKKDKSAFIDDHGREAVNFQITLLIYAVALPIIAGVLGALTCGIGLILMIPAVVGPYILGLIGMIQAAMAANRGEFYRYPMTFRFVS